MSRYSQTSTLVKSSTNFNKVLKKNRKTLKNKRTLVGFTKNQHLIEIDEEDRTMSSQVIGQSNSGKSYLIEGLLRQNILAGEGLFLLDPHGTIYHRLLNFCLSLPDKNRAKVLERLVLFNPSEERSTLGYDPFRLPADFHKKPSTTQHALIQTKASDLKNLILQIEGLNPENARVLSDWLEGIFYLIIELQLNHHEIFELVEMVPNHWPREAIVERSKNPLIKKRFKQLNDLKPRDIAVELRSTYLRVKTYFQNSAILNMLSHDSTLNFLEAMNTQKIVLCNFKQNPFLPDEVRKILGSIMLYDIAKSAHYRPEKARPLFTLAIDECPHYLTSNVIDSIFEHRKRGISVLLGHQELEQLEKPHDHLFAQTILDHCQSKYVFRLGYQNALIMAPRLFTHNLQKEIKDEIYTTQYVPQLKKVIQEEFQDVQSFGNSYQHVQGNVQRLSEEQQRVQQAQIQHQESDGTSEEDRHAIEHSHGNRRHTSRQWSKETQKEKGLQIIQDVFSEISGQNITQSNQRQGKEKQTGHKDLSSIGHKHSKGKQQEQSTTHKQSERQSSMSQNNLDSQQQISSKHLTPTESQEQYINASGKRESKEQGNSHETQQSDLEKQLSNFEDYNDSTHSEECSEFLKQVSEHIEQKLSSTKNGKKESVINSQTHKEIMRFVETKGVEYFQQKVKKHTQSKTKQKSFSKSLAQTFIKKYAQNISQESQIKQEESQNQESKQISVRKNVWITDHTPQIQLSSRTHYSLQELDRMDAKKLTALSQGQFYFKAAEELNALLLRSIQLESTEELENYSIYHPLVYQALSHVHPFMAYHQAPLPSPLLNANSNNAILRKKKKHP